MNTCFVDAMRTGGWTGIKGLKDVAVSLMMNINHCATMLRSSSIKGKKASKALSALKATPEPVFAKTYLHVTRIPQSVSAGAPRKKGEQEGKRRILEGWER